MSSIFPERVPSPHLYQVYLWSLEWLVYVFIQFTNQTHLAGFIQLSLLPLPPQFPLPLKEFEDSHHCLCEQVHQQELSLMLLKLPPLKLWAPTETQGNDVVAFLPLKTLAHLGHEAAQWEPSPTEFVKNRFPLVPLISHLIAAPIKSKGAHSQGTDSRCPLHVSPVLCLFH